MLDTIVKLLKESGVYGWEISDVRTDGWEFYFIRHELDQNRAKRVEHIMIRVFQLIGDGQFIGSASAELAPTASEEEARALIESLAYRATLVKNKPYTLNPLTEAHRETLHGAPIDVPAIARSFIEVMQQLPETETEDINSYEIFVSAKTRRFLNSEGIDVEESYPSSMIEVVVNARKHGHEIELYRNYESGTCDAEGLKKELAHTMQYGKDRLRTQPTPNLGTANVLFSGSDAVNIYDFFVDRLSAQMVCRRMSDWEIGKPVADGIEGDRVMVTLVRELENSSANRAFDREGAPIRDTEIMRDSVPVKFFGDRMFSSYLGLKDTFMPTNILVEGGTRTEEELRSGPYLEAVEFSDFQVDPMTGDIFGEIRLAYWHDGEKTVPVSGGSVSGSMFDFVRGMLLSEKSVQYDNYRIPALTLLKNVTVTGAAE